MARTAITLAKAVRNGGVADNAANVDQANGMVIAAADPEKTLIRVTNTAGSALNIIARAGDSAIPAWMAGQGDVKQSVAATTGADFFGPFDSARVLQSDGSLHIDFDAGFTGKVTAVLLP